MSYFKILAHLLKLDLYVGREQPSGRIRYVAFDMGKHVMDLRNEFRALTAERDQLRARVADWEIAAQQGHPDPCTLGSLCPYCEIERLRARVAESKASILSLKRALDFANEEKTLARQAANEFGQRVRELEKLYAARVKMDGILAEPADPGTLLHDLNELMTKHGLRTP